MKLIEYLQDSAVTAAFREAAEAFLSSGQPSDRVAFHPHSPPIKIARTLTKALEVYSSLPIESVEVDGRSGCEFFCGDLVVRTAERRVRVRFEWNCKWKARELGWVDYFGFPDQTRAAREFGHDCFREWEEEAVEELAEA
ncbi:MAG: hypothetical protein WD766_11810 [Gemmatimonadota bacterium]